MGNDKYANKYDLIVQKHEWAVANGPHPADGSGGHERADGPQTPGLSGLRGQRDEHRTPGPIFAGTDLQIVSIARPARGKSCG